MKWVSIDIGVHEIKAAVRDYTGNPTKLSYEMSGVYTTNMPSEVYYNKTITVGEQAVLLGHVNPDKLVYNWLNDKRSNEILTEFLSVIRENAVRHYATNDIGVVVLYEDRVNDNITRIAKNLFKEVQCKNSFEILSISNKITNGLSLVVDFGYSTLKICLIESQKMISFTAETIGFSTLDISEVSNIDVEKFNSDVEIALYGQLLDGLRRALVNNESNAILSFFEEQCDVDINLQSLFDNEMSKYLLKCWNSCTSSIRNIAKGWEDIDHIIITGGAGNYYKLKDSFEKFKTDYLGASINPVIISSKDAGWQSVFGALSLPLRQEGGVIIRH